jgi:hypothetical protein
MPDFSALRARLLVVFRWSVIAAPNATNYLCLAPCTLETGNLTDRIAYPMIARMRMPGEYTLPDLGWDTNHRTRTV